MCGIIGIVTFNKPSINIKYVKSMVQKLAHRGPDDAGYLFFHTGARHNSKISFYLNLTDRDFKNKNETLPYLEMDTIQRELNRHDYDLFLGHRRLSIIDLTSAGHQPMSDLTHNIWVVFNGEIYNYQEIRRELEKLGHRFQSNTDTEVIIYSYIEWGIKSIEKFNGMFAFALYDNFKKKLYLCRDRYGIKPLYYFLSEDGILLFSSEIKSILEYRDFQFQIDKEALLEYFTFQNFISNKTLHKNVFVLEPGHYIEICLLTKKIFEHLYWDFDFFSQTIYKNEKEYLEELENIFSKTIERQLISDVPVGAYLSGGIDTGLITVFASKYFQNSNSILKTFTIGFDLRSASGLELSFDEREKSEYMSYLFKTEHYEMVLKSGDMERCLKSFVYHLEEPRVGQSYPNFYAAKLASKFVKVVLSGTGGDELFAGYPWRYYIAMLSLDLNEFIERYFNYWQRLLNEEELKKVFAPIHNELKSFSSKEIFRGVFKNLNLPNKLNQEDFVNLSLYFELKTFLHGLLIVEDKLSMAHSLETRVPFLDNEIVDFAQKLPLKFKLRLKAKEKIDENEVTKKQKTYDGKLILRNLISKYVPDVISVAPKQGFSSPDSSWFKGESIDFVKAKLFNKNALIYNYMDRKSVLNLINEHLSGKKNRRLLIWSLLNFEEWCRIYGN